MANNNNKNLTKQTIKGFFLYINMSLVGVLSFLVVVAVRITVKINRLH